jgi:hypothetical protein
MRIDRAWFSFGMIWLRRVKAEMKAYRAVKALSRLTNRDREKVRDRVRARELPRACVNTDLPRKQDNSLGMGYINPRLTRLRAEYIVAVGVVE